MLDIVTEVDELEDADLTELSPPLGSCINTDALLSLVDRDDGAVRVTLDYLGYPVTGLGDRSDHAVGLRKTG